MKTVMSDAIGVFKETCIIFYTKSINGKLHNCAARLLDKLYCSYS